MSYIGNTPGVSSQRVVLEEVISGSAKSAFTPISGYTLGYVDVLVNGVEIDSNEFTATDGVTVTLTNAAQVGDTVKIKTWLPRGLSDGYLKSEADAKYLTIANPSYTGTLTGGTGVVNLGSGQFYKDASGKIGIGIASPTATLDVQAANLDTSGFQFKSTTGTNAAAGRFNNTGGNAYVGLDNSLGTRISGSSNAAYALNVWHEGAYPIIFGTSNVERARISSSGIVGINVIPAVSQLDVYSSSSSNTVLALFRGSQGNDNSLPVTFGTPYLKIGQTEWRSGAIQTIGFGYSPGAGKTSPAEIGIVTTNTAGQTYGDIVFATRTVTTDTAPTERVRIDSVGRFTVTNQPVFSGRGGSNGDAGYGLSGALFKFSTIHTNTGSRWDNSTGLFTAPVAGNYLVCWDVLFDDTNSTIGQMVAIRVNGSDRSWIYSSTAMAYGYASLVSVVSLSANDTIGLYCYARVHTGSDTSASICLIN